MQLLRSIEQVIKNPDKRFIALALKGYYNRLSDKEYVQRMFKAMMGYSLDLENPKTFNEKLQWLKLYNRQPEYTILVDKYKVRQYIADKLGEEYLIPLLGVWDNPGQIDFNILPNRFVLKCNHNSGAGICVCKDKSKLNKKKARKDLRKALRKDYYLWSREWPYKNVPRKVICEEYMTDDSDTSTELTDYKFFCFNGYVDCVMVCIDRQTGNPKFYFFDQKWNLLRLNKRGKAAPKDFTLPKPDSMDEMFEIAHKLSAGIPFARIDLYSCNNHVYFGEITLFPDSGFDANLLPETDVRFGKLLDLSLVRGGSKC